MELFSVGISAVSQGWERSVMTMALLKGLLGVYCTCDRTELGMMDIQSQDSWSTSLVSSPRLHWE